MKGSSHNNMNTNGRNLHVSMFIIGLTESPKVIIFTRSLAITRMPENSSIIPNGVSFVFVNAVYLLREVININHISDKPILFADLLAHYRMHIALNLSNICRKFSQLSSDIPICSFKTASAKSSFFASTLLSFLSYTA